MVRKLVVVLLSFFLTLAAYSQPMKLALLVYNGGGDWYANPTSLKNLASFCNQNLKTNFAATEAQVEVGGADIFNYPFVHATGHGRISFSDADAQNLRLYLEAGGFLHIDDNFGMDEYVRPEMKKVFPELDFVELPFTHAIYKSMYSFPNGLPKIHEHEGAQPKGFGLIYKGRLVCFYTHSCDLGDGWEDAEVHNNPPEVRQRALQMGANIIKYVFEGK